MQADEPMPDAVADEGGELPVGWVKAPIGSLCSLNNGRAFKPTEWGDIGLPIVRIQNLNNKNAPFNYFQGKFEERYFLRGGELLFAWSGTPGTSFGAHVWRGEEAVLNQHIFRVDFDAHLIDKKFFRYAIDQKLDELIDIAHGGVGLRHVTKGKFESTKVALPPLGEQKRIAAKLDALLARVEACRDRLDAVPRLLKRFRQAVLGAATSGALTEDCREGSSDYSNKFEFLDADSFDNYSFPSTWNVARLGEIARVVGGITKDSKKQDHTFVELPYLRVANVQRGYLDLGEIKTIRVPPNRIEELLLKSGDILFNEGGDIDKLGRGWVWSGEIEGCTFQNHVFRARLNNTTFAPKFFSFFGNSRGLQYFLSKGKQTTNLASINRSLLAALPVVVPPPFEQAEIVRRVEALFAIADKIEARYTAARKQVDKLTPALLAKAFRGELVPQDPADEPASALLARIRAERAGERETPGQAALFEGAGTGGRKRKRRTS